MDNSITGGFYLQCSFCMTVKTGSITRKLMLFITTV